MREIKFRAWDKGNKAMREVWNISWDFTPASPTMILALNPVINSEYVLREGQFEIMQYTGLKDKNNKDIYEGDCLGHIHNIVEYMNGSFCINGDRPLSWLCRDFEIVGNIYENK